MSDRDATHAALAANVRRMRVAARMSLSQLAQATGVGKATLSGIESGTANATLDTLVSIAAALRVGAADLLEPADAGATRVSRAATRAITHGPAGAGEALDDVETGGRVAAWRLRLRAREHRDVPAARTGRRGVLVLDGVVRAGPAEALTELDAGDYLACPADRPLELEAVRAAASVLLLAIGEP